MSSLPPQPLSGHFLWSDFTETHVPNLFTGSDNIPTNKTLLILVARYIDPTTQAEIGAPDNKIGHWIGGFDNYWVFVSGNPPSRVEYAFWNNPQSNTDTEVRVYELKGFGSETSRIVQIKSLKGGKRLTGGRPENGAVTQSQWGQALTWSENY